MLLIGRNIDGDYTDRFGIQSKFTMFGIEMTLLNIMIMFRKFRHSLDLRLYLLPEI